jgi:hypothetical protein
VAQTFIEVQTGKDDDGKRPELAKGLEAARKAARRVWSRNSIGSRAMSTTSPD